MNPCWEAIEMSQASQLKVKADPENITSFFTQLSATYDW